jgi:hypothetical protein
MTVEYTGGKTPRYDDDMFASRALCACLVLLFAVIACSPRPISMKAPADSGIDASLARNCGESIACKTDEDCCAEPRISVLTGICRAGCCVCVGGGTRNSEGRCEYHYKPH